MMRKSTTVVSLYCLFVFTFFDCIFLISSSPLAPALYVFGDSLFDSGNNNMLPTLAKADYLPYGVNFAKGTTGRFTNGRTVADFIAEFLGLPYSPPYMALRGSTTTTGWNYASGSCGILPETGSPYGRCLNMNEQIDLFERTVDTELPNLFQSSNVIAEHLSKSIFIFAIGSNDYLINYLNPDIFDTSKRFAPQPFAQYLVNELSRSLRRLYDRGARKIVVFDIGPIGCIPSIVAINRNNHQEGKGCVEEPNQVVTYYNHELQTMLQNLRSSLQGSIFVLGQGNWLGYDAIKNPSTYGLIDTSNPCCRTWGNGTSACIPWTSSCRDPEKHFFWDAYHMTEAPSSIIAARCFNGTSVCSPFNIYELAQM